MFVSIAKTKEQIATAAKGECPDTLVYLDRSIGYSEQTELGTIGDFQALASSHTALLEAAKDFRDVVDGTRGGASFADFARCQLDEAIQQAEQLEPAVVDSSGNGRHLYIGEQAEATPAGTKLTDVFPDGIDYDSLDELLLRGLSTRCSQCGQLWSAKPCGPTHVVGQASRQAEGE
jgi:hypothetical protein